MHDLIKEALFLKGVSGSFWAKKNPDGTQGLPTRFYINHNMPKEVKVYIEFPNPETLMGGSIKVKIYPYDDSQEGKNKFMNCLTIAKHNWQNVPQMIDEIVMGSV